MHPLQELDGHDVAGLLVAALLHEAEGARADVAQLLVLGVLLQRVLGHRLHDAAGRLGRVRGGGHDPPCRLSWSPALERQRPAPRGVRDQRRVALALSSAAVAPRSSYWTPSPVSRRV